MKFRDEKARGGTHRAHGSFGRFSQHAPWDNCPRCFFFPETRGAFMYTRVQFLARYYVLFEKLVGIHM